MAAAPDRCAPELIDLTRLSVEDLDPVLQDECLAWRAALSWDFTPSADLVRRFVRIQSLNGFALRIGKRVIGYTYYVCEERKGLIGDLYVIRDCDSVANETALLTATMHSLASSPAVERVETQLMMMRGAIDRSAAYGRSAEVFPRIFMIADLEENQTLEPSRAASTHRFAWWDSASWHDDVATVVASAYAGHVDSRINDQYRSWGGARRFLSNLVQYPGCGHFYAPASLVAQDANGRVVGAVLASLVAPDTGHITQVCVMPGAQGSGIGYELIRRSLEVMRENGCSKVSLTVTASNTGAISLYQRMGFRATRRFAACVWEGF